MERNDTQTIAANAANKTRFIDTSRLNGMTDVFPTVGEPERASYIARAADC
jgi:hypothetical protein